MKVRAFITHKEKEKYSDCQDRFSVNADTKSVSVSDGMSQSIFQKQWAQLLVDAYSGGRDLSDEGVISELKNTWKKNVETDELPKLSESAKRRSSNSLAMGYSAGATFVGIRLNDKNKINYTVLGDSCLILLSKNNEIKEFISSQQGDEFDNHPDYFDSGINKKGKGEVKTGSLDFNKDMKALLVSDPFSDYLTNKRDDKSLLEELLKVQNHSAFCELVKKWREKGMHNDDSTLVIVENDGKQNFERPRLDNIEDLINGVIEEANEVAIEEETLKNCLRRFIELIRAKCRIPKRMIKRINKHLDEFIKKITDETSRNK